MKSLADALMGNVVVPILGAKRVHVCEDDNVIEDQRPISEQVREWCEETLYGITSDIVASQFGIESRAAATYLHRLGKKGVLVRVRTVKPEGRSRPIQVWAAASTPEAVRRFKRAA